MDGHLRETIYQKNKKIQNLEHRIANITQNLDSVIKAMLFDRGNKLIYELDSSKRILTLFKA